MNLTYKFLLIMFLGLIGSIIGLNIIGIFTVGGTNESNYAVLAIIPFTVFIDGILLFLILQIIKPLDELTKKSKEIANGDLTKRIQITTHDELGQLGVAFNDMAQKLEQMKQGLEDQVTVKTSELQKNVENLKMQQAKDDAIFKSISEGLILTDNQGHIIFINKNAEKILDLSHKETVGKILKDLLVLYEENAKFVPDEVKPFIAAIKKGETSTGKFILVKKNDQKIIIEMTSSPVMQHSTETQQETVVFGSITTIRDITKEREIDRMKTEFISLASHQLRTPLSSIKWYTEMLLNGDAGPLSKDQTELAKSVSESSKIMSEIVNALLNVSRIELGTISVKPKPTNIKDLIESCVKEVEVKYKEKNQSVSIEVPENFPEVSLDPELIKQVYLNLLTNAIKYSPEGGKIMVGVSLNENKVISLVSDNGYGIPKIQQENIFTKFFRADNIVKKETDGNGLGLYFVKAIVESSKGKIWFESEEGKGTKFYFSLPLNNSDGKE